MPLPTPQESWAVSRGTIPFLNWKAQRTNGAVVPWSTIASGAEDAAIAARADAVKAFGSPVYLTFHHEPEDDLGTWGTAADYAAAFRRVVTVFRSRGVTNVAFVWTMMNWTFDPRSGGIRTPTTRATVMWTSSGATGTIGARASLATVASFDTGVRAHE